MRFFLAFDTATDHLALALGDLDAPGVVVAARDFSAPRAANTVLLPALEALLHKADLCVRDLGCGGSRARARFIYGRAHWRRKCKRPCAWSWAAACWFWDA